MMKGEKVEKDDWLRTLYLEGRNRRKGQKEGRGGMKQRTKERKKARTMK
jgi:hypothetical protein